MQLTGSRKIFGGLALSAVLALGGVAAFAQGQTAQEQDGNQARSGKQWRGRKGFGGKRGGLFGGRFAERLNLTDAQKEQIKQITSRYRETTRALRQQERGERRGGNDLLQGGAFNEAQVRAAAQARAQARVEMEVSHARMMSEIYNVLTAEQKAQLAADRREREQRRQQRKALRDSGQTQ